VQKNHRARAAVRRAQVQLAVKARLKPEEDQ
jgi:hypothetical protein